MCARSPRSWHTRHIGKPEVHGSPSHVQAWFRAGWKRVGERPPDLCPVGSLTAGTFPLSVPSLLSGVWKRLSSCFALGPPPARPSLPRAALQVLAAALTGHRVHVVRDGPGSRGAERRAWGGAGQQGRGSRAAACLHICIRACSEPFSPSRGARRVACPTCPCCLCVPDVRHRGGGSCGPRRGDVGPRQKPSCLPRAGVQGASGHRLAGRVGGCDPAAREPERPEVPVAGPGAQASLGPAVCVSRTSLRPRPPAFPAHPQSSGGPGGSLWTLAPSPLSWAPAGRADQGAAALSRGPRSPVPVDGWCHLLGICPGEGSRQGRRGWASLSPQTLLSLALAPCQCPSLGRWAGPCSFLGAGCRSPVPCMLLSLACEVTEGLSRHLQDRRRSGTWS